MVAARYPVIVDAQGKPKMVTRAPVRFERVTADVTRDPDQLADILTRLVAAVVEGTAPARASAFNAYMKFEGVVCGASGASVTLHHGFGRPPMVLVTRFLNPDGKSAPSSQPDLREDPGKSDANTIVLNSYVAGLADVVLA